MVLAANLGYPGLGAQRELKRALEQYWSGKLSAEELLDAGKHQRMAHWQLQQAAGIDVIPSNDSSFYDHVLDMALMVGAIPQRYGHYRTTIIVFEICLVCSGWMRVIYRNDIVAAPPPSSRNWRNLAVRAQPHFGFAKRPVFRAPETENDRELRLGKWMFREFAAIARQNGFGNGRSDMHKLNESDFVHSDHVVPRSSNA